MKLLFLAMVQVLFIIFMWASLSSASSLDPRHKLLRTSSQSDEAFVNIISEINQYIKEKQFNVHKLMNFPLNLAFASVNLTNGQMRDFSTIELHKSSILPQDGGKIYWTLGVGLEQFLLQYNFSSSFFSIFNNAGNLRITVPKNNILLSGTVNVLSRQCTTTLEIVTFMDFPDVDVAVLPLSIKNFFLKYILKFALNRSKILLNPTINSNLKDFILDMVPPSKISEILCKYLK